VRKIKSNGESEANKVSVNVGQDGANLNIEGVAPVNTLVDLLSPFSHGMGWIGDRFSDLRRKSAIRAARKAKELLAAEGIVRGDIPPKILLPWLEGASLETEEDSLTDMWAGLLARAVKSSDAVNISYIETLKRLGKKEAQLLHFFATDTSAPMSIKFFGGLTDGYSTIENPLLQDAINKLDNCETQGELRERLNRFFLQMMGQIIVYSVDNGSMQTTEYFDTNEHTIANLEILGLIKVRTQTYRSKEHVFSFTWFQITKFAFDLFWACNGVKTGGGFERLRKMASSREAEKQ
jgi:hypothetical protein